MRQDRSQTVVGVRQVLLQREGALQFRDGLDMLEISGWSPKQKCLGDMTLGQSRIQLEGAVAVELGFVQPTALGFGFKVAFGAYKRENRVREGKSRIASHCIHQELRGLLQKPGVARRTAPVSLDELRISHRIPAVPDATLELRGM